MAAWLRKKQDPKGVGGIISVNFRDKNESRVPKFAAAFKKMTEKEKLEWLDKGVKAMCAPEDTTLGILVQNEYIETRNKLLKKYGTGPKHTKNL